MERTYKCKCYTYYSKNLDTHYVLHYKNPVSVFQRHRLNISRTIYITYRHRSDGAMWIVPSRNKGSHVNTLQINNLNAHQRRTFKKLKAQAEAFKKITYSCDNCIYLNERILKGDCEHVDPEI